MKRLFLCPNTCLLHKILHATKILNQNMHLQWKRDDETEDSSDTNVADNHFFSWYREQKHLVVSQRMNLGLTLVPFLSLQSLLLCKSKLTTPYCPCRDNNEDARLDNLGMERISRQTAALGLGKIKFWPAHLLVHSVENSDSFQATVRNSVHVCCHFAEWPGAACGKGSQTPLTGFFPCRN